LAKEIPQVKRRARILSGGDFPEASLPIFRECSRSQKKSRQRHAKTTNLFSGQDEAPNPSGEESQNDSLSGPPVIQDPHQLEIHKLNAAHETRLAEEKRIAYQKGLTEGQAQGRVEWESRAHKINQTTEKALTEVNKTIKGFFEDTERSLTDLSVFLAEKIVGEATTKIPDVIKNNVDKCLNLLAGSGKVSMKINPSDYEIIKTYMPNLLQKYSGKFTFIIEPDQNISCGGCLVELDGSMIDGRIETQLEKLKQHMQILS